MTTLTENAETMSAARAFMTAVRGNQLTSGQTLKGRSGLESSQRMAIRASVVSLAIVKPPLDAPKKELILLLERFEEMCRRQKFMMDAKLRPSVLSLLATELWVNMHELKLPTNKLIAATAYHGPVGAELPKKFPQLADTPGLFRHAVMNYPANPSAFLDKMQAVIGEIAAEREFHEFKDTPGMFKQAALRSPTDPRMLLRFISTNIASMAKEEEFSDFSDNPGIFRQAAMYNTKDPRAYLRKVQKTIQEMMREKEFQEFIKTPGMFKQAVVRNPKDPRGFLRKIKKTVAQLAGEKEFAQFHDKLNILQHAAVHNPSNPREFLRRTPKTEWHAMLV